MKILHRNIGLIASLVIIPTYLCLERVHKARLVLGTWEWSKPVSGGTMDEYHYYETYHPDGTGEDTVEWRGRRDSASFTYKLRGLASLEKTSDYGFCGVEAVPLNDPCLHEFQPSSRTQVIQISFSADGNKMYYPRAKPNTNNVTYAFRTILKPLPTQ
jgi:hypothetical protein